MQGRIFMTEQMTDQMNEVKLNRERRKSIDYFGLVLWYRFDHDSDGVIWRVSLAYRPTTSKRYIRREYAPKLHGLTDHSGPEGLQSMLRLTIEHALFTRGFLEKLSAEDETILGPDTQWGLIAPYALSRLHAYADLSQSTKEGQWKTLRRSIQLWGDWRLREIVPTNCAPDLLKLPITSANDLIALIRRLYVSELRIQVADPNVWFNYDYYSNNGAFSPARQIFKVVNDCVMTEQECLAVIKECCNHPDDSKYKMTLLALLTPISLSEVCALRTSRCTYLDEYPQYGAIQVTNELRMADSSLKTERARERSRRSQVVEILNPYQRRILPAGRLLTELLCNPGAESDETYYLSSMINKDRRLRVQDFRNWINTTFKTVVPGNKGASKAVKLSDRLHDTCCYYLQAFGLREEELRYQLGMAPLHTDAKYYVDFECSAELAGMAVIQDIWMDALGFSSELALPKDATASCALRSIQSKRLLGKFKIQIDPTVVQEDIRIELSSSHGFDANITASIPKMSV